MATQPPRITAACNVTGLMLPCVEGAKRPAPLRAAAPEVRSKTAAAQTKNTAAVARPLMRSTLGHDQLDVQLTSSELPSKA